MRQDGEGAGAHAQGGAAPDMRAEARRAWVSAVVASAGLFLAVVSTTVVSVALPSIGRGLHATNTDLQWVVDAYVLVYAGLLIPGGVLGDRRGRKGVFMLGIAVFGLGSLVAGLAPSVAVLLLGRVIQGIGPALLVPGSLTIIRASFEDERLRAAAIGLWSMSAGLALAVGPVLGGALIDGFGWRWVFLFNVPLAVILVLVAAVSVRRLPRSPRQGRFDWLGAGLATGSLALLVFAVIEGQSNGWGSATVVTGFAAGAVALAGFVWREHTVPQPLIDVSLFGNRRFTAASAAALIIFFAFVGVLVYFSVYFQQVQGHSPLVAGLDVSAIGIALAVASAVAGSVVGWIGERWPLLAGLFLSGAATLGLLRLGTATSASQIWWIFALVGAGVGLCGTVTTTITMSAVDAARAGMASAIVNELRQVGQVFGVAVLGALVYAHLPGGSAGQPLSPSRGALFVAGLRNAIWVSGLTLLAVAVLAAILVRDGTPPTRYDRSPAPAEQAARR